jgi:PAS domain S-box-containing protein
MQFESSNAAQVDSGTEARRQCNASHSGMSDALLDSAPDGILAVDEWGRIETVNAVAARLLGDASAGIEGQNLIDLLRPSVRGDGMAWLRDVQSRGGFADVCFLRSDGAMVSLQLAVRAMQFNGRVMFACYLRETYGRRRGDSIATLATQRWQQVREPDRRRRPTAGAEPVVNVVVGERALHASLAELLQRCGWKVESFHAASQFLANKSFDAPSCAVLDIESLELDWFALRERMNALAMLPIIFAAGRKDVAGFACAMKSGAFEVLTKPLSDNLLLSAIRGAIVLSRSEMERIAVVRAVEERYLALTPREREVMRGVVAGMLNKQVAAELGISEVTVKAHRGHLMRKMQARSLAELVNFVAILGLAASRMRH